MRFKRHLTLKKGQLDIVPLIDVVFLLLIFFMLTSSFVTQSGIKINLPKALTSEAISEKNLIITITDNNTIYLKDKAVGLDELRPKLKQAARENKSLFIKADRKASLGKIVEVWDLCRDVGLIKINIATNPK
jgi:biopolymer transport protein ExbD